MNKTIEKAIKESYKEKYDLDMDDEVVITIAQAVASKLSNQGEVSEIKRYDFQYYLPSTGKHSMVESENGEYVKYDELVKLSQPSEPSEEVPEIVGYYCNGAIMNNGQCSKCHQTALTSSGTCVRIIYTNSRCCTQYGFNELKIKL